MRIPLTILGGYLGAGKTTAINRLLADAGERRIAVLVNDFGSVNIDASLIRSRDDATISLTNGCVCCSIADNLGGALDMQTGRADPPEHIVVETSGVAEIGRIAAHIGNWPGIELATTICMVDAETVLERASDKFVGSLVRRQIAHAGTVVLNKLDLVDAARLERLKPWISTLAPDADVVETQNGDVAVDVILGTRPEALADYTPVHGGTSPLRSRMWQPSSAVDLGALTRTLDALPESVHRLKGFVLDARSGRMHLVQRAGRRSTISPWPGSVAESGPLFAGLVLIGTCPAEVFTGIEADLERCVVAGTPI